MRRLLLAIAVVLGGCAAHLNYTRTDGGPVDAAKQQATLAQCKGEGASAPMQTVPSPYGVVEHARKENTIIDACMARNGYIQARK